MARRGGDFDGVPWSWSGLGFPAGEFFGVVAGFAESGSVFEGCWAVVVPGDDVVVVADGCVAVGGAARVVADVDEAAQRCREEPPFRLHRHQVTGVRGGVEAPEPDIQFLVLVRMEEVPWPFWVTLPVAVLVCVTGTIAALGDTLFPSATLASGLRQDFSPAANFLVRLRILHPFIAAASGLLFATVAFFALRVSTRPTMRVLSVVVIVSTFVQLCAGVLNLSLLAPIPMQILHLLLADVVWVALVLFVAEAAVPLRVRLNH